MTPGRARSAIHHPATPVVGLAVAALVVALNDLAAPSGTTPLSTWLVLALAAGYAISGSV
ncbi:hypothetical protein ABFU82_16050 [Nocardioides sp. WV_118_6]|uniref:hypothetical protein n=1 Tax=Nocardioides simplex TaxID=2045 RepID=UPI00214FB62C|nr:hypothetical protein [Pimelobacter simplex]UUW90204.1 hypothetical protein M0M43_01595 [Pimelobacter simplex]UUW94033.1 hypothetical protein M0M48_20105 [Pimelobacter simplex]